MSLEKSIINEFNRRVFTESYDRIFTCLDMLSENQIWQAPNQNSNSIGNLILHLHGNVRQWMLTTFNNSEDKRERSLEFTHDSTKSTKELKEMLLSLKAEVLKVVSTISMDDLNKMYTVQVYKENGISIIIHVIEHFSYHTGQIALLTKILCDKDLNFYPYSLE